MTIWTRIKNLFSKPEQTINNVGDSTPHQRAATKLSPENMADLMRRLENTLENAYSCEEAYALLDEYVELVADDEEARQLMPLVENHLDMCPDCREKFEILLHVLKTADAG